MPTISGVKVRGYRAFVDGWQAYVAYHNRIGNPFTKTEDQESFNTWDDAWMKAKHIDETTDLLRVDGYRDRIIAIYNERHEIT